MNKKRNDLPVMTVIGLAIGLAAVVFVSFLMLGSNKEAEVVIANNTIEIKSQFGTSYEITDIQGIHLVETIPAVGRKVYGAGLGEIKKGDFMLAGLGKCKLYIHVNKGPYIYIDAIEKEDAFLNFTDPSKAQTVYEQLVKALQ